MLKSTPATSGLRGTATAWRPLSKTLNVIMDIARAYIRITGKKNYEIVSSELGIKPTSYWNVGDKRRDGSEYEFSNWSYEDTKFENESIEISIANILNFIESKELNFQSLYPEFDVTIQCVGYHEKISPGFHLSKEIIAKFALLGVSVDFDLYCENEKYI